MIKNVLKKKKKVKSQGKKMKTNILYNKNRKQKTFNRKHDQVIQ